VVPAGIFKISEEDAKEVENLESAEDFKPPQFDNLVTLDNWVHSSQNILKEGRLVHMKPEIGDD